MGSESIAHDAEGYWLRAHECERNNCFSKIQLVYRNIENKKILASLKAFLPPKSPRFLLLVGYNI